MRTVRSRRAEIHGGLIMPQDKINLTPTYVVIGNGIAGVTAAEILRSEDSAADITVIADDPFPVYDRLLLANGARAARLTCPGVELAGVTTLRTVADYQAVVSRLGTARRIVVSGSGTLALETIETLRHRGYQVTHLLRRRTLWSEVL